MTLDTRIPVDYHPDALSGPDLGPDLDKAKGALRAMYDTWAHINEADAKVSDKQALAFQAQAAVSHAARRVDANLKDLRIAQERAKERLSRILARDPSETTSAEIRLHFKQHENPVLAAEAAVRRGDVRSIKAIFEGPAYLSGLGQDTYEVLREHALQVFSPEEYARVDQYAKAIAKVERAAGRFTEVNAKRIRTWAKLHERKALKKLEVKE